MIGSQPGQITSNLSRNMNISSWGIWQSYKPSIGRIIFVSLYLFIVFWFRHVDVWNNNFSAGGNIYIIYNILRVLFLFYFAWMVYVTGKFMLSATWHKGELQLDVLDSLVVSSFLGAAVLNLIMFLLGVLRLYYFVPITVISGMLVYASYPQIKTVRQNAALYFRALFSFHRNRIFFYALFLGCLFILSGYLFLVKGLLPDRSPNMDCIGHYLPYYREVLFKHGILPNKYFFHYYFSKGYGINFLAMLLTDIQSSQSASFYFLALIALIIFSWVKKIIPAGLLWPLGAVSVFFTNTDLLQTEFQKNHIILSSFFVFFIFSRGVVYILPDSAVGKWRFTTIIIAVSIMIMSPIAITFLLPFILFEIAFTLVARRKLLLRESIVVLTAMAVSFIFLLVFNYFSSGMLEFNPWFLHKLTDLKIMHQWLSPMAITFSDLYNAGERSMRVGGLISMTNLFEEAKDVFLLGRNFIILSSSVYICAVVCLLFLRKRLRAHRLACSLAQIKPVMLLPVIFMLVVIWLVAVLLNDPSFFRYLFFLYALQAVLFIAALKFVSDCLLPQKIRERGQVFLLLVIIGLSLAGFTQKAARTPPYNNVSDFGFLTGKKTYRDIYQEYAGFVDLGLDIQSKIGKDNNVLVMNLIPGLYGLPSSRFQRPFMCEYNHYPDFDKIMFGTPGEAAIYLKKDNINYFLILTNHPFMATAYAPFFDPVNMNRFLRLIYVKPLEIDGVIKNAFLLTWRQDSEGEDRIMDIFLREYEVTREATKYHISGMFQAYQRAERIYSGLEKN